MKATLGGPSVLVSEGLSSSMRPQHINRGFFKNRRNVEVKFSTKGSMGRGISLHSNKSSAHSSIEKVDIRIIKKPENNQKVTIGPQELK